MAKLIKGVNDFASQKPWAVPYWSGKNELKPDEVSAGTHKKFLFEAVTENGIEYSFEKPLGDITKETGFPIHKSFFSPLITGFNDLKTLYPELACEFVSFEGISDPSLIKGNRNNKKQNWKCVYGHSWSASLNNRIGKKRGCPVCVGKKIGTDTETAWDAYPELRDVWSDRNTMSLKELLPKSGQKVVITCGDHYYSLYMYSYNQGNRCGVCSGRKVIRGGKNSLLFEYPTVASEYMEKNPIPVDEISKGTNDKVWWKHSCGHEWTSSVSSRIHGRAGCPRCNRGWGVVDIIKLLENIPLDLLSTTDKLSIMNSCGVSTSWSKARGGSINSWVRGKISDGEFLTSLKEDANLPDTEDSEELPDLSDDLDIADVEDLMDDSGVPQLNISNVLETISSLDKAGIGSTFVSDEDLVESMVSRWVGQIWSAVWDGQDVEEALKDWPDGNTFQKTIRDRFMNEFESVTKLQTPKDWPYSFEPSMMQKYVAVRMASEKRVGNWSGTGAGKTASAVLANLHLGSPETIVLCPNPVVSNWVENTKTLSGWHIFNFDKLSSDKGLIELDALIKSGKIGMVVVDELHFTKFRGGQKSQRRQAMGRLMGDLPDAYVLGMTATPVINNLQEAVSLLEIIEGHKLDHLGVHVSMENVVNLHQRFIRYGVRYTPNYKKDMSLDINETIIDTDGDFKGCKEIIDHERRAVELKMGTIIDNIGQGGIIYCHYIDGIVGPIQKALDEAGLSYGVYTGEDKTGLNKYLNDEVDVLIGSSSIGTGIDGLQHKKPNLVFASMPWTDADYRQIVGRIYRQGNSGVVKIHIPQTDVWCTQRLRLIETKRSLSKAVMDGELPQANVSDEEVREAMDKLILRLQGGEELPTYETEPLDTDLISLVSGEFRKTERNLTDFQSLNRKWNTTNSSTLHDELSNDASEWYQYHEEYSKSRETWEVVPFKVFSEWLSQRKGKTVVDLGCGEALLNGHENKVLSFDHVAVNDKVTVADISDLSEHLEDNSVDIAILSLALMGSNWNSYLDEALRITGLDSQIWIAETKTHVENWELEKELESRGLTVNKSEQGKFVFFRVMV